MNPSPFVRRLEIWILLISLSAISAGCSKKEDVVSAEDPSAAAPAAPPAATAQVPANAIPAMTSGDVSHALAQTEAALKAAEWDKAAQALISVPPQQLTEKQAMAARNQMIRLQSAIASGVDSGDPKAKAAADMIRRASSVR